MTACPYCNKPADLAPDTVVYKRTYGGMIWICRPCNAYVGTHKNSKDFKPLGRLANKELRAWKVRAHAAFDPLWRRKIDKTKCTKGKARKAAYAWLGAMMIIPPNKCHIGMFSVEQCKEVVRICEPYRV